MRKPDPRFGNEIDHTDLVQDEPVLSSDYWSRFFKCLDEEKRIIEAMRKAKKDIPASNKSYKRA